MNRVALEQLGLESDRPFVEIGSAAAAARVVLAAGVPRLTESYLRGNGDTGRARAVRDA